MNKVSWRVESSSICHTCLVTLIIDNQHTCTKSTKNTANVRNAKERSAPSSEGNPIPSRPVPTEDIEEPDKASKKDFVSVNAVQYN